MFYKLFKKKEKDNSTLGERMASRFKDLADKLNSPEGKEGLRVYGAINLAMEHYELLKGYDNKNKKK